MPDDDMLNILAYMHVPPWPEVRSRAAGHAAATMPEMCLRLPRLLPDDVAKVARRCPSRSRPQWTQQAPVLPRVTLRPASPQKLKRKRRRNLASAFLFRPRFFDQPAGLRRLTVGRAGSCNAIGRHCGTTSTNGQNGKVDASRTHPFLFGSCRTEQDCTDRPGRAVYQIAGRRVQSWTMQVDTTEIRPKVSNDAAGSHSGEQ